eukprot:12365949-Alexandrium_andersonii.AAC.1
MGLRPLTHPPARAMLPGLRRGAPCAYRPTFPGEEALGDHRGLRRPSGGAPTSDAPPGGRRSRGSRPLGAVRGEAVAKKPEDMEGL